MTDVDRVLVSCRLVWDMEDQVTERLARVGLAVDIPRFEGQQLEENDLLPIIDRYVGILAGDDFLTRTVLSAGTSLRVISKWGIGIDAIDLDAAQELGITVFNTPGVFGEELADYAMGYLHMMARRQHEVDRRVKEGSWHKVRGVSLAGRTLGIIGLGSSGRALARRAAAASMVVIGADVVPTTPDPAFSVVSMEEILSNSDVISLHVPATPDTQHLIDERSLSVVKPGVWLINTSRGSLIDEDALVAALADGRVGAAALDVFENEPVRADHPLLSFDSVIAGSHNGSNTSQAIERTTNAALENLIKGLES
jgi:phosphoglycerate dehydrogenase-like enzyme